MPPKNILHKTPDQLRLEKLISQMKNVKSDQQPQVIKYLIKNKNSNQLQTPIHNIQENTPRASQKLFKTLQKVQVEPIVQLDQQTEMKWKVLSQNCKELLDLSRRTLNKTRDQNLLTQDKPKSPQKIKFITKRQSIELRLNEIVTQSSPTPQPIKRHISLKDPFYQKFKKYYQKIGLPEPQQNNEQQHFFPLRKFSSMHISPKQKPIQQSTQLYQKKSKPSLYLNELLKLSTSAQKLQIQMKKDQTEDIDEVSQKVSFIQQEFDKFHKLLKHDDSF